ncbi:MAG: xanthine dehydrogenase accessory protein XdhC [Acetobacteraceae bacterium]
MAAWLQALAAAERDAQAAVLVTVLSAKGSTPREAGAKMVVSAEGLAGTIGGGNLEHECEAAARALLTAGANGIHTRDFPLGPALGQCCGGHVTVLFEILRPPRLHVALFGAGHVGKALVKILAELPCRVTWIDSRPEALPANLPASVAPLRTAQPAQAVEALPADALVIVMTHDHQLDYEIVAAALRRPDLQAVGLIGSATKRARFAGRLLRDGLSREAVGRLICPIGLPGIQGKEPAVVAVAVAAQLLQMQPQIQHVPAAAEPSLSPVARSCGDCVCPPARTEFR